MCARAGSPRPRSRRIYVSVSALRICSSRSARGAGDDEVSAGAATASAEPRRAALSPEVSAMSSWRRASTRSWTVAASATTRSGSRTPQAVPKRTINSTRSRLPSPSSRSKCAAAPRAASSSSPRAPSNSVRSWRTVASVCASTKAARSSFAPVALTERFVCES